MNVATSDTNSSFFTRLPIQFWAEMKHIAHVIVETILPAILSVIVVGIFILGVLAVIGYIMGLAEKKKAVNSARHDQPEPTDYAESTDALDRKGRLEIEIALLEDLLRARREMLEGISA